MAKEYYILSITHTKGGDEILTWWRPDNSGYTVFLESAGRYSEETVKGKLHYYDNKKETIAVPCERAEEIAYRCVPWETKLLKQIGVSL
jgi:hypothetical protein